ncbi:MAG: arsenate reductase ArsC [Bacteroidales bacterium]|nr:arsenate reductase ArsC [Bacteroidales bacterium]MDD4030976.1 arsenate reductase ArsC [Bacteroidales bacterium]MDD4435749.1 arsenate reductase ArsC [Bacteroidales bacterium]MDD5733797.1 arsenate reductase ArsC [Bacteroidales bacterium]
MKILILCTGNSCRSQMAQGFLQSFDYLLTVRSAGTNPAAAVHPLAVKTMLEVGIDISRNVPALVDDFLDSEWDYVITVCDNARESCPLFTGKVKHRLHMGFEDPAQARGTSDQVEAVFRKVRDQIKEEFFNFYKEKIKN